MALTREFKETVVARIKKDTRYRRALLAASIDAFLDGDIDTGKSILRDYINATIGFERLSKIIKKDSKSIQRMLGPNGNPRADNIFSIIKILKDDENLCVYVKIDKRKVA